MRRTMLVAGDAGVVADAVARGWWGAAGWILLFDVLLNGYPVMLQRYNRALLGRRYSLSLTDGRRADITKEAEEDDPADHRSREQFDHRGEEQDQHSRRLTPRPTAPTRRTGVPPTGVSRRLRRQRCSAGM